MFPVESWTWYDPDELPPFVGVRRAWDLAASEGEGDWTVGQKVGKTWEGDFLILDVVRERKSGVAVKTWVEQIASIDGVAVPLLIERERTGAGKTILEFYAQALPLHQVLPGIPDGSKEDRARPASLLQQAGRLKLPRRADGTHPAWVEPYIDELRKMMGDGRKGRHDDQIDTLAYAVNDMLDQDITYMATTGLRFSDEHGLVATSAN
jgi:phage terminase large subunit-like protein